jgi:hypothetical protein
LTRTSRSLAGIYEDMISSVQPMKPPERHPSMNAALRFGSEGLGLGTAGFPAPAARSPQF